VDVGNFLEFERAFEGDGVVDAATEEEEVLYADVGFSEIFTFFVAGEESFELAGEQSEFADQFLGACRIENAANFAKMQREEIEGGELAGEGFGGGDADFGAGVGLDSAVGFAGDHGADHVADGEGLGAASLGLALGGDGVGGFARLRDHHRDGVLADDRVAVTPFAGVIDFHGNAGQAFDHEFSG
jgi:hypothetical protein